MSHGMLSMGRVFAPNPAERTVTPESADSLFQDPDS